MKKRLLFSALVAVAAAFSASAEVLTPYTEQFEGPTERPKGWVRGGASYSYQMGTYTFNEDGGHSGGCVSVKQSSNYWSSYYNNYSYNDILVTPAVSGDVSIWVRKSEKGSEPTLTFFNIADNTKIPTNTSDFQILEGTDKNLITEDMDITDWTEITVKDVPANTYLGIRAHDIDIDDFSAASANVVYRAALIADVTKDASMTTNISADENNQVTFIFTVSVENTGDLDFPESEEGFKVELKNKTADNALFGTGYITEAIPCGKKIEKKFEMTGNPVVAPGTTSNNYIVTLTHEKTGSIDASLGYFTVIPYLPNPKFMLGEENYKNQSSYNDVNITDTITIGAGAAGTARTLWLWNSGTAPLEVTAVTLSDGFTADVEPFTLNADEKKEISVALAGEAGLKKGSITFSANGLDDFAYGMRGLITTEGNYSQDFEGEGTPENMVIGNSWSIKPVPTSSAPLAALKTLAGEKYIECTASTNYADRFSTPLLTFAEGDKLCFMATKTDNTSSKLNVYTSPDRQNWTLVKTISANSNDSFEKFNVDKPTGTGYGTYEFKLFDVDMPEGNFYVQFEAGGARIDNIHGGKKVDVDHDLFVVSQAIPDAASVNTRYITNIKLRNLMGNAETDYSVVLEVNGEKVAEAAETPELAPGAELTFDLRYTPHNEGECKAAFVFISGDDRVVLAEFEFTVTEEKAESVYQVGDVKITSFDPVLTFYNAQCQIIYRADQLGMDEGVKITGFTFTGYNESEITKNVKVWIQNTEDEGYDKDNLVPAEKDDMTLVFNKEYTFQAVGNGSNRDYQPVFVVDFDTPFTYTGKSIRIMIEQTNLTEGASTHHVSFTIDNSVYSYWDNIFDNRVIENEKEYAEDLDDEPSWHVYRTGYPVTYFNVAKDVVVAKGAVTDEFSTPLEGVTVSYTSDDILYTAVTDAEGNYSMNIANVGLTYVFSAQAATADFDVYTIDDVTFTEEELAEFKAVRDVTLRFADRTATLSGSVISSKTGSAPTDLTEVILTKGENTYKAEADAEGKYSLTVPELADTYAVEVKVGGFTYHTTDEFNFESKAHTKDFTIDWNTVTAKGCVTDDFGTPVEDATVTFKSGDVTFTDTTDADGNYSIEINKAKLTYTMTVAAEEFKKFTKDDIAFDAEVEDLDVTLNYIDRTATLSGKVVTKDDKAPEAPVEVSLIKGSQKFTGIADADGNYSVTVLDLSASYSVEIKVDGNIVLTDDDYKFSSKDDNKDFVVEWSSISAIGADGDVTVKAVDGTIYVDAPAGVSVTVYAINGTLVGTQLSHGETLTFGSVAPGVYVAAGVKVLVR